MTGSGGLGRVGMGRVEARQSTYLQRGTGAWGVTGDLIVL